MFLEQEMREVEVVADVLEREPLLRAAFTSGGLTLSQVRSLILEEAGDSGSAEPSSAGVHGGCGRPAPARRAVSRNRSRRPADCRA